MRRLIVIASSALTLLASAWSGAKLMLDSIGRIGALQDLEQSSGITSTALRWLFSTPWWAPALIAAFMAASLIAILLRTEKAQQISSVLTPPDFRSNERTSFSRDAFDVKKIKQILFNGDEIRPWELVARGDSYIRGKTFIDCILVGPAMFIFTDHCSLTSVRFATMKIADHIIEIKDRTIIGAYIFVNCRFQNCTFEAAISIITNEGKKIYRCLPSKRAIKLDIFKANGVVSNFCQCRDEKRSCKGASRELVCDPCLCLHDMRYTPAS